jgi:hypothetical protein
MMKFRSYQVPEQNFGSCCLCGTLAHYPEVLTARPDGLYTMCGDCLLAAMMSRLEVVVDGIETKIEEREKIPLDTRERRV